jgi:hypothetical protein
MTRKSRNSIIWIAGNVFAAGMYLAPASRFWASVGRPEVAELSGGNAFAWFFTAVPIFLTAMLLNLAVHAWAAGRRHLTGSSPLHPVGWVLIAIWLAALVYDGSRHGA